jgi:anion-transporting  ArsA/GET3 family ATPase
MDSAKKFEIFSGTGGVGKTTMATSRAIYLTKMGKKVLLITIDPAKRLKDLLNLRDEKAGEVVTIRNPLNIGEQFSIDAELMNPEATIRKIAEKSNTQNILNNRIMKVLSKPYGGLNEILAIVELQINLDKDIYDTIVLDTPPGPHFLDFLESAQKIQAFFDQSFIDIFNYIGKTPSSSKMNSGKRLMTMMISGGVKKLLGYLKKVTGGKFIEDFMHAIGAIYETKDTFLGALKLQEELRDPGKANWFLVTSVDQSKVKEALNLSSNAKDLLNDKSYVILNKCLSHQLTSWTPEEDEHLALELKKSFIEKENNLKSIINKKFNNVLEFPEILKLSPTEQVLGLVSGWEAL